MKYADGIRFYEGATSAMGCGRARKRAFEGPDLAPRTATGDADVLVQLRRPSDSGSSIAPSLSNWRSLDDDDDAFASASSEEDAARGDAADTVADAARVGHLRRPRGRVRGPRRPRRRGPTISRPPRRGVARVRFPNGDAYEGAFARGFAGRPRRLRGGADGPSLRGGLGARRARRRGRIRVGRWRCRPQRDVGERPPRRARPGGDSRLDLRGRVEKRCVPRYWRLGGHRRTSRGRVSPRAQARLRHADVRRRLQV